MRIRSLIVVLALSLAAAVRCQSAIDDILDRLETEITSSTSFCHEQQNDDMAALLQHFTSSDVLARRRPIGSMKWLQHRPMLWYWSRLRPADVLPGSGSLSWALQTFVRYLLEAETVAEWRFASLLMAMMDADQCRDPAARALLNVWLASPGFPSTSDAAVPLSLAVLRSFEITSSEALFLFASKFHSTTFESSMRMKFRALEPIWDELLQRCTDADLRWFGRSTALDLPKRTFSWLFFNILKRICMETGDALPQQESVWRQHQNPWSDAAHQFDLSESVYLGTLVRTVMDANLSPSQLIQAILARHVEFPKDYCPAGPLRLGDLVNFRIGLGYEFLDALIEYLSHDELAALVAELLSLPRSASLSEAEFRLHLHQQILAHSHFHDDLYRGADLTPVLALVELYPGSSEEVARLLFRLSDDAGLFHRVLRALFSETDLRGSVRPIFALVADLDAGQYPLRLVYDVMLAPDFWPAPVLRQHSVAILDGLRRLYERLGPEESHDRTWKLVEAFPDYFQGDVLNLAAIDQEMHCSSCHRQFVAVDEDQTVERLSDWPVIQLNCDHLIHSDCLINYNLRSDTVSGALRCPICQPFEQ